MLVVVVLVGAAIGMRAAWPAILRSAVVWRLEASTGRAVTLEGAELDLYHGRLVLRGLRVMDRDGQPLAALPRLETRFSPRDLLRGHLRISTATLQAPALRVIRTGPAQFNVSDLFAGERGGAALGVTVEQLVLFGGAVEIEDRTLSPPRAWRIESLALHAEQLSTVPGEAPGLVRVQAVAAGSPVSLMVTGVRLRPLRFDATINVREADASLIALYLPPASPLSPERGTLDASASVVHEAATGTRIVLDMTVADLALHAPGKADAAPGDVAAPRSLSARTFAPAAQVTAPSVRVTVHDLHIAPGVVAIGTFEMHAERVVLEDARLAPVRRWQADGVVLEARGLSSARDGPVGVATAHAIVAGSPVSVFVTNVRLAPLALHATAIVRDVDVSLVRLYLPADLPAHPERGVVNATVQVDHDADRGTRFALDAALSDVEVRRPVHFVTAPALRVTAEDISFVGGAVTVGQVRVGAARLTLEDRTLTPIRRWPVQDLVVEASHLSSRRDDAQGVGTARATVAGATLSAWLTRLRLDPLELHATLVLRAVDLRLVEVYLPATVPVEPIAGVVDASVSAEHSEAAGTRLQADAIFTRLEARARHRPGLLVSAPSIRATVTDARRQGEAVSIESVEMNGNGTVVDAQATSARLDVDQLRIAAGAVAWPSRGPARVELHARLRDRGELNVTGTAELTAPPSGVAWTAELAGDLRSVNLAPLAAYLPGTNGLRGRATATVAATLASSPALTARVRGDAAVTRLSLADGARTPLSARRVEVSGLKLAWPERVDIAQMRLVEPRALVDRDREGRVPLLARFGLPSPPDAGTTAPTATGGAPTGTAPDATAAAPDATAAAPPPPAAGRLRVAVGEVVVERGSVVFVDERTREAFRLELPRLDMTVRDVAWPAVVPARLRLDAALPRRGTVGIEGTVSAEPAQVDVQVLLKDASLSLLAPYLEFPARVRGRLDATLAVTGPISPAPALHVRGSAGLQRLTITDRARPVITVEHLETSGIDATWPGRVTIEALKGRRAWALIERDRTGTLNLKTIFTRMPGAEAAGTGTPTASAGGRAPAALEFRIGEIALEDQGATIIDGLTTPPARFDIAGARLAVQDFAWPSSSPAKLQVTSPMPGGGRLVVRGTLALDPIQLAGRVSLDAVDVARGQPYVPIQGRVSGRVTGDLGVQLSVEPLAVQLDGDLHLQSVRLSDEDRPLVTAGRVDVAGLKVDWPQRVSIDSVRFRRPRLLVERDEQGDIVLQRLLTPGSGEAPAPPGGRTPAAPVPSAAATVPGRATVDVRSIVLDGASGRFVDRTTRPAYVEELTAVDATVAGLTTAPGGRGRVHSTGKLSGGASFKLEGEFSTGDRHRLDLTLDLRDFVIPRANPYLDRLLGWTATRGSLNATAHYTLDGTRLDARHDLVVRQLDVVSTGAKDEVERRLGLPLSFLVSLMKDARGDIRLAVPVAGDLGTREFDFREAVWGAVRNFAIRLLALPFSRVGSLFFSEDSRVVAVAIEPVVFAPGGVEMVTEMEAHLNRVAVLLRDKPTLRVGLVPIVTAADVEALKPPGDVGQPTGALRELATRRLQVVREAFARRGIDPERLTGRAHRTALVEASGPGRVELDLAPSTASN